MRKLVCNFEAPDDDVYTLYDNWEKSVARFPHVSNQQRQHGRKDFFAAHAAAAPALTQVAMLAVMIESHRQQQQRLHGRTADSTPAWAAASVKQQQAWTASGTPACSLRRGTVPHA